MHITLTDILSCPHCGPEFGLILLADRVEDRRVIEGVLGCANCREKYEVRAGHGVLRTHDDRTEAARDIVSAPDDPGDAALRAAALMGVSEGPALVLVAGDGVALAPAIAQLVADVEVIAIGPGVEQWSEQPGLSRLTVGGRLPFYSGKLHGIHLGGAAADRLLEEAARALHPIGRLVVTPIPPDAERRLQRSGLGVIARDEQTLVAARG